MAAAALAALLPLLLASSTPEVAAAAAQPNSTATATMVDLLAAGAGDLTCPGGRYSCPSTTDLCVCDRSHRCVACLTHAASLNHGEVAAVGAIAQILEDKFNVDCVTGAAGAVSDFIDAYNDFQGSHYGDVAQDLVHGMKSFQSTLKACKKQNWFSKVWNGLLQLLKSIPEVRAALIVWDGVHILDDVLAMGPAARADDWMLLGNCVGDIVSRVAIDDRERKEEEEEEEVGVAGRRAVKPLQSEPLCADPGAFVISGARRLETAGPPPRIGLPKINGTYERTQKTCNGKPVYQKGGSSGPVLYSGLLEKTEVSFWTVGPSDWPRGFCNSDTYATSSPYGGHQMYIYVRNSYINSIGGIDINQPDSLSRLNCSNLEASGCGDTWVEATDGRISSCDMEHQRSNEFCESSEIKVVAKCQQETTDTAVSE